MNRLILCLCLVGLTGCVQTRHTPLEQRLHYQCGTLPLTVTLREQPAEASLILDGRQLTLPQVVSASGVHYDNGEYGLWTKGNTAFVERQGRVIINDCVLAQ